MHRPWLVSLAVLLVILALPPAPGHAGKLADDGRAGVVLEVQGTALLRPAGRARWTPLGPKSVLHPGDVLRTRPRGAHALEISLKQGTLLVGPGAELQLTADGTPRLIRGEAEAVGSPEAPFPVVAAGDFRLETKGTAWLRARGKQTEQLEKAPRWVEGYRASASNEWMGSLLANVDGRDVPLAVGYHKVDVEVRDQIARTTVEQSFVNATDQRLEGVFHFPLPADASISGFGMWIGGELVEADIVERQRARQIYEDILRRKKDPGLLEWEGGNIFKARVFPIEPHSEKRIRIRYTQVLPLEGDTWRYRYALRSELLRTKPLRELQIAVRIVSERPMQEVASPTHEVTVQSTGHEATVEFRASEYRPTDDFEVAVRVDPARAVTAIPHRRGEDGYFMLMLAPPAPESDAWSRELSPEGAPLDVILLADTSGSMDEGARQNQAAFLGSLLALLGTKDRFRLAAFDADVHWIVEEPTAPDEAAIATALDTLAARRSLGWTDLDAGFEAALGAAGEDALVVYVGDGVSTTGDADPAATANRLRALGETSKASVHAVAASSSYEQGVMRALAETGGGSVRTVGAHPALDAYALLSEAARPSVKDLRVRIDGIRTARVYPERLPNLPLGSQQVVLGRFLPTDEAQTARVLVEGTLDGEPVRYTATLEIPAADVGNSFLPRLWGRQHIDALLAQGSPEVNAEIVSFSERFGIMTPLTSFLVLESDEDRERYGVERRVRMRDGERFFADAKDRAMLEQRRALMRQAGRWRLAMRRDALLEIARLGRDLPFSPAPKPESLEVALGEVREGLAMTPFGGSVHLDPAGDITTLAAVEHDKGLAFDVDAVEEQLRSRTATMDGAARHLGVGGGAGGGPMTGGDRGRQGGDSWGPDAESGAPPPPARSPMAPKPQARAERKSEDAIAPMESPAEPMPEGSLEDALEEMGGEVAGKRLAREQANRATAGRRGFLSDSYRAPSSAQASGRPSRPHSGFTLQSLGFPAVPPAPTRHFEADASDWDPAVLALLRGLVRRGDVRNIKGGLHFVIVGESLHPTRGDPRTRSRLEAWIGPESWHVTESGQGFSERRSAWSIDGIRGVLAESRGLARTRAARPTDANAWWLPLWDLRARDVIDAWIRAGYRATLVSSGEGRAVVELSRAQIGSGSVRLTIDTARRAVLETRWLDAVGRTTGRITRRDFVEVSGRHWAQRVEQFDADDRRIARRTLRVEGLAPNRFEPALEEARRGLANALVVHGPLPARHEAKQAVRERRPAFLDHLVLCLDLAQQQRMDESLAAWDAAAALVADKPGRTWVRPVLVQRSRDGEALKAGLLERVEIARSAGGQDGRFLSAWLLSMAQGVLGPRERGDLLDALRAAYVDEASPLAPLRELGWTLARARIHDELGASETAHAMRAKLAETWPHRVDVQLAHEGDLWGVGRYDAALALLEGRLETLDAWTRGERTQLFQRSTTRLWDRRLLDRLHRRLETWVALKPRVQAAWQQYVASLFFLGRSEEADAQVLAMLQTTLEDDDPRWHAARLQAGVALALGDGWHFRVNAVHPAYVQPLAEAVLRDMRRSSLHPTIATRAFRDWRFRRTDAWREVQTALFADLAVEGAVASMPTHRLLRYLHLLPWGRGGASDEVWAAVTDEVLARWRATESSDAREPLEREVIRLLDARGERERVIAFLEEALARAQGAGDDDGVRLARALFERLLQTPDRDEAYSTAREDRCFALLPHMVDVDTRLDDRRAQAASDVRRLADRLFRWRQAEALGSPEARKDLTRAALASLRREARTKARGEVAARLRVAEAEAEAEGLHRPWLQIERLGYAVEHGEDLPAIVAEAEGILERDWERPDPDGDDRPLDRVMRERAAVVLAYAATRGNATDELRADVLRIFEEGAAAEPRAETEHERAGALLDWRYQTWRLLVALDRADALENALESWIVPAKVQSRWRIALGYLFAETGRVAEAAEQFEAVAALDELAPSDYAVLADWYLVLGDDARRDRAILARYEHMNEGQLSNLVWQFERRASSRRGGVPGDFDPETVRVLRVLMEKASYPGNYWWRIRNLYRATKDFRVLAPVARGLTGHTKESVYGFLGNLSNLTREVHEEATLDAWQSALTSSLATAETPLDRRALQLALSRVASRAGQVAEADPAHAARALAAMRAGFQERGWQPGEPILMASWLRGLGTVRNADLRAEQLRQLDSLRAQAEAGTSERVRIADQLALTLWSYNAHDRALDLLSSELDALRSRHGGRIPQAESGLFDRQLDWLRQRGRYAEAERLVLREIDLWAQPSRRRNLRGQLVQTWIAALGNQGMVSLGRGEALFEGARRLIEADALAEPAYAGPVLSSYARLHATAEKVGAPADAGARLDRWARETLPTLLARVPINAAGYTGTIAGTLRTLEGPHRGIALLLFRHDAEPDWLERIGYTVWMQHTYSFARWRHEAGPMPKLDDRLEALVVAQLEQNLVRGDNRGRWFWNSGNKYAWRSRFDVFAATASRVAELNEASLAIVVRCAHLLRGELGRRREGVEMLAAAHARGILDEGQRWILARWRFEDHDWQPSLALVDGLIADRPENLGYRIHRVACLARLGRDEEARAELTGSAEAWKARERWSEGVAANLGASAAEHGYAALAERWMEEAIRLRQEARGHRGGRDATLGRYYRSLALARAKLGKAEAAVQAASTALLMANPRSRSDMGEARAILVRTLKALPSLPGYIEGYDAQVAESGLDTPILRKAFASVFHDAGDHAAEIVQLRLARDLDAGDADVHKRLVAAYDRMDDAEGAVDALFGSITLNPYDHEAYEALAQRYLAAGRPAEAERARTTLAEISPNQPGGHRALAVIRGEQKRLAEAVTQWRQVVRTERTDPTGHLGLARALIAAGRPGEARTVLEGVIAGTWEPRFADVKSQAAKLLAGLGKEADGGR